MGLRHLLFFLTAFCLSGCFAAYIPSPQSGDELTQSARILGDKIVAFTVDNSHGEGKNARFRAGKSFGHQYLFPGIPVTSLYFERDLADILGELLLFHPKFGLGSKAVTNLCFAEFRSLFGPKASAFKITIENFSTTAQDYFFLRKAVLDSKIDFSYNDSIPETFEINSSRYISKASVEVLSELIEESLYNSLQETQLSNVSKFASVDLKKKVTVICLSESRAFQESACLSKKNVLVGLESYFRKHDFPFVSFRQGCPDKLPNTAFFLSVALDKIEVNNESVVAVGNAKLTDLQANSMLKFFPVTQKRKLDYHSSQPQCSGLRDVSEDLAEEFFRQ